MMAYREQDDDEADEEVWIDVDLSQACAASERRCFPVSHARQRIEHRLLDVCLDGPYGTIDGCK
jgi:hypothetical protein